METKLLTVGRLVTLFVGCIGIVTAGSVLAFGAYINALKKHFNYTQSTVEMMGSMSNFGLSLAFPAGMMCEKFGPRWTSLAAIMIAGASYMLLYSTTLMESFYQSRAWLQYIYFFMSGFGTIFMYMPCLKTNMNNFPQKHRGKIVALLDASVSTGPVLFSALYGAVFARGHTTDEQNQKLGEFYLLVAIVFGVNGFLGMLLLKDYPFDIVEPDRQTIVEADQLDVNTPEKAPPNSESKSLTGLQLVRRFDYHFIFWAFMFCGGVQLTFQNNQATYLKSYDLEGYTTLFTTLNPVAGVVAKLFVGFVSDAIVHRYPRVFLLLVANILQTIILTIAIFFGDVISVFTIMDIIIGLAYGAIWCLTPTMMSEFYGMDYLARNWGTLMFGNAFSGLAFQQIFGWIYDSNIRTKGSTDCRGLYCFRWSFIMLATVSFCSVVFNFGLFQNKLDEKRRDNERP